MIGKIFIFIAALHFAYPVWALVSQPTPIFEGESAFDFRLTREGGVMKPSQNKDSFQSANILISQATIRKAPVRSGLKDLFWIADYRTFQTQKEKKRGTTYHDSYLGHQVQLGGGFNLVRTPDYTFGVFAKVSPVLDIHEEKFGNPRADLFQLGWNGGFTFGRGYFFESSMVYGSGIPDEQNQYVAISQSIGKREERLIIKAGPYIETDLEERADYKYSQDFGPQTGSEKIRLYKMGVIAEIGFLIDENSSLSLTYLQKIFGQYLPSTNALSIQYSIKF